MPLCADRRDFKTAFRKHFHAFSNWNDTGSEISKRLILVYCVECGLKCLVMEQARILCVDQAQKEIQDDLYSHDIQKLLKRVNCVGPYTFSQFCTVHGDIVNICTYHQACRYSIRPIPQDERKLQQYENQLVEIAIWLKEQVEK